MLSSSSLSGQTHYSLPSSACLIASFQFRQHIEHVSLCSLGYHLAECWCVPLVQVPFSSYSGPFCKNGVLLITLCQLVRSVDQVPNSAPIHLVKCTDWSFIQVISQTVAHLNIWQDCTSHVYTLLHMYQEMVWLSSFSGLHCGQKCKARKGLI